MATFNVPKRMRTSYGGEAARGPKRKPRDDDEPRYDGPMKKRSTDGRPSQWALLYPLRPSTPNNVIGPALASYGPCRTVRSIDNYFMLVEYEHQSDAVEMKNELHYW